METSGKCDDPFAFHSLGFGIVELRSALAHHSTTPETDVDGNVDKLAFSQASGHLLLLSIDVLVRL